MEENEPELSVDSMDSNIEINKTGHSPIEWEDNKPVDEEIIRADKITEDYAIRIVLIPEKLDMDRIKKEHLRKFAAHEELWDTEYFPYVLYKTNGSRKIMKVLGFHGAFALPESEPKAGGVIESLERKPPKFQISRLVYQMRSELKTDRSYLKRFMETEIDGREIFYDLKARVLYHLDVDEWIATTIALWIMGQERISWSRTMASLR